jgi:two-component system sensor histidine kinase KdpD
MIVDMEPKAELMRIVRRSLPGAAAVLLVAYLGFQLGANFSTTALLHILVVVLAAMWFGFWPATITSLVAFTSLNYFFVPPIFSFVVADPRNWVPLMTFELTAVIVSRLSAKVRMEARTAILERRGMERLYELSRSTLLLNRQQRPGTQIVSLIQETMRLDTVALFDVARVDTAGSKIAELEELARSTYVQDRHSNDPTSHTWQRVLRLGSKSIGALVLRGNDLNLLMVDAIASLTAIALDRANSFDKESRAEAGRQSEQLRATVLDALAHAFKTPLTVIRTASSGLLEACRLNPVQQELATLIDDESVKLNELTTRLLRTARLETSETQLRKEEVAIPQLIEQILREHSELLSGHEMRTSIPDIVTYADPELLGAAITQLIDNAAKYATPDSPITIAAKESESAVLISVHNEGSTVRPEDRDRIFERFYRSAGSSHRVPGTGLGLSIAKKAAEAHRGHVWVGSEEGKGTTFFLSLPCSGGNAEDGTR